jgi:hypothetical protein
MRLFARILLGSAVLAFVPFVRGQSTDLPTGWVRAGDHPAEYEMAVDPKGGKTGKACPFIRARTAEAQGFGTLMQTFDAAEYVGKRLRLSALVKSAGITKWAGLWMRVDGITPPGQQMPAVLAFDNMQNRPIAGTRAWARYDVVLDVPGEASGISFGLLLSGAGQAWMDGLRLEVVGPDIATTDRLVLPKRPNLSFEP